MATRTKRSLANKKRWAQFSLEQRQKMTDTMRKSRWANKSDRQRKKHGKAMALARWGDK